MEKVIEVKNLSKQFNIRTNKNLLSGLLHPEYTIVRAVEDISFEITKGEAVAFLGPNGAGKTTTTKMLTGLIYPTAGHIDILGFTPFDRKKDYLRRIGLVMGNKSGLNWDLTANQSFWLFKHIYHIADQDFKQRLHTMTKLLEVEKLLDTQVRRLSLGERMKLELVGSLLHNPDILFLDEPTIGLDIISKKRIRQFLKDMQKEFHTTVLLTSHDMDDVEQVCSRVIIINKGHKVYDNSLTTLVAKYEKLRYVRFVFETTPEEKDLKKLGKLVELNDDFCLFSVASKNMVKLITDSTAKFTVIDLQIESTPLEDILSQIFKPTKLE